MQMGPFWSVNRVRGQGNVSEPTWDMEMLGNLEGGGGGCGTPGLWLSVIWWTPATLTACSQRRQAVTEPTTLMGQTERQRLMRDEKDSQSDECVKSYVSFPDVLLTWNNSTPTYCVIVFIVR